ncbi:EAL domain-containing protein [Azoarcus sp. DD4]|uniref:EAL domain-containing protein n=1 Tax=Azoarcus sp. DD4 TaxID=2027405 RepID=UPI00197AC3F4|nr:EAL domain-containing protein [Azoarcus sp. DD4]
MTLAATDSAQTHREKLARILLDGMYQFVGLLDAQGTTLEINRAALEGAGLRLADVRGRPFWDTRWWAVSQETRRVAHDAVRRAAAGEFVRCDVENYGRAAGGETIVVDFSLLPVRDRHGDIVFLLAEGRDITEMKRAEAEISRKNETLQQLLDKVRRLDAAKREFFANVSHELRTPLALILGPAEAMLAGTEALSERQHRDLLVIHRNAATLLKHVNDLLDLEKVDAGKLSLNYARIDLARAVRAVAAHFDALAPQRSLTYAVSTPDTLLAEVDPEKFDRVLVNLLSNAFKFTPAGGRISCTLAPCERDRLLLTVQDSGPGVRPELRSAIFDRFHQGDGGTAREFGGTGLGLAIARDFVGLHGGTITVTEAPAGGALFQVELPRLAAAGAYVRLPDEGRDRAEDSHAIDAAVEELERGGAHPGAPPAAGRATVLVAEDNAEMRRFIAEVLGDDYHVVTAADGAEALTAALAAPPDLLVTDLMMPRLDGEALVAELRAHPQLARLPVLVLSARGDEALRLKLLAEAVQDYVTKPFSPHELRARVRNLVTMKRARDALQQALASRSEDLAQLTQQLIDNRQALQRSHDALQESEQRWRAVYQHSAAGIALIDTDGRILAANPALQQLLGYTEDELRGRTPTGLSLEDGDAIRAQVAELVAGRISEYHALRRYQRSDGSTIWANASVSMIPGTPDAPRMLVAIIEDITERKRAEDRLRHLAYFDALTDLPNRVQFEECLRDAVAHAQTDNRPVAVIILALERFKEIAYTLGQANGDLLLQQVGPRFRSALDENALLAHFGGRHFAALLPNCGVQAARETALRLQKTIERPFDIAGFTLEVGANLGIAVFPGHAGDATALLRCAEIAQHHAHQTADGCAFYASEQDSYKPRRLQLMGELRTAIEENQLVLYCQPKLDLKTREIVALETLVRWQHPIYGLIAPDQFVPYIESTGLIGPLTRWIIDAAVTQCHGWQRAGMRVPVAVNLSARNLTDPALVGHIQGALLTWGADAGWIGLEITESAIMTEPQTALETLKRLSSLGFRLFIDDFGTGYSSLAYLQQLPVDAIKIDKSFVLPMLADEDAATIVRSTLELGHNLGLAVIAEGVENEAICERLAALGCDEAQGYYLSPPMPVSGFIPWVKTAPWPLRATAPH